MSSPSLDRVPFDRSPSATQVPAAASKQELSGASQFSRKNDSALPTTSKQDLQSEAERLAAVRGIGGHRLAGVGHFCLDAAKFVGKSLAVIVGAPVCGGALLGCAILTYIPAALGGMVGGLGGSIVGTFKYVAQFFGGDDYSLKELVNTTKKGAEYGAIGVGGFAAIVTAIPRVLVCLVGGLGAGLLAVSTKANENDNLSRLVILANAEAAYLYPKLEAHAKSQRKI